MWLKPFLSQFEPLRGKYDVEIILLEACDGLWSEAEMVRELSVDNTGRIVGDALAAEAHIENSNYTIRYYRLGKVSDKRVIRNHLIARANNDFILFIDPCEFVAETETPLRFFIPADIAKFEEYDVLELPVRYYCGDMRHRINKVFYEERVYRNTEDVGFISSLDHADPISDGSAWKRGRIDIGINNYMQVGGRIKQEKLRLRTGKERNFANRELKRKSADIDVAEFAVKGDYFDPETLGSVHYEALEAVEDVPTVLLLHPLLKKSQSYIRKLPYTATIDKQGLSGGQVRYNILELGCGPGKVLQKVQEAGHSVWGLEPSSWATDYARSQGLNIMRTTIEDGVFDDAFFDVIYGVDVLEHCEKPRLAFGNMVSWLKDEGLLILACPNPEAEWTDNETHFLWSPCQHYGVPSRKAFEGLAKDNGMEIVSFEDGELDNWVVMRKGRHTP